MNLLFRLFWMLIASRFGARLGALDEGVLTFRCWPTDLDMNMHMTNSRYASFMDLARVSFMIRNGGWQRIRGAGLYPVLGSLSVRFRRPIKLFQKFTVSARVVSWDDRWIYIEHKMIAGGELAAPCIVNTTFLSKQSRVPTDKLMEIIGYSGPKPEFTEMLVKKSELDAVMKA